MSNLNFEEGDRFTYAESKLLDRGNFVGVKLGIRDSALNVTDLLGDIDHYRVSSFLVSGSRNY